MSIVNGQLVQQKISAGSVAAFGQSLRTFVPQFQVCPDRGTFDYVGREAPPDSIDTQTCPGGYPSSLRIEVENSLRPFISDTYFNLPIGISGGADPLFGQMSVSRQNAFGYSTNIDIPMDITAGMSGQKNLNDMGIGQMQYGGLKFMGTQKAIPQQDL